MVSSLFPGWSLPPTLTAADLYRYELGRLLRTDGPAMTVCGVNPSTADASLDDPTIRRCVGFAERNHAGSLVMVNLFAYRSPDVADLTVAEDPVGPDNDEALMTDRLGEPRRAIVCAWGVPEKLPKRLRSRWIEVSDRWIAAGARLFALRLTASGHPEHPLYLPGNLTPRRIERAGAGWRWAEVTHE